jgi:hypothetical protein
MSTYCVKPNNHGFKIITKTHGFRQIRATTTPNVCKAHGGGGGGGEYHKKPIENYNYIGNL